MNQSDDDAHGRVWAYSTDCYAEFYDIWNSSFWPPHYLDEQVHWDAIQGFIQLYKDRDDPINIVDIGAGSGRQLKDILERASSSGTPLPNTKFHEVDLSKAMLKRGEAYVRARPELLQVAPVEWHYANAENYTSTLPQLEGAGDLVLWAGGGFSHLTSEAAQSAFLKQLAKTLRNRDSIGLILVLDQSIPSRTDPAASEIFEVPYNDLKSIDDPSITYDKSVNDVVWKGAVRHDRWTVTVKRHGEIMHSEDIEHTLRNLDEEAWPKLVAQAGLTIAEVKEVKTLGLYYYLKKA